MIDDVEVIEEIGAKTFDFTQPLELMDAETKNVYYRLSRVAKMANGGYGDRDAIPDGKVYTESQVMEILGEDYAQGLVIDKKCCG